MSSEKSPNLVACLKFAASAILGAGVGACLGAFYLINLPVKEITEAPDEYRPETHYVLKGRSAGGDAWKFKADALKGGEGEVTFLETELNRWAASFSTDFPEEKPSIYLEPQRPLFRLEEEKLLVSAKADVAFGMWKKRITLSLEGDFIPDEAALQIQPEKLYIGSMRVPGLLKDFVWNGISSVYTVDEEFQSLWSSVASANISESQLVLTAKQ